MYFLAQSSPSDIIGALGGTVLGTVVLLLLFGWLWAKPAVETLLKENVRLNELLDRKDAELALLRQGIDERVIPVIEKNIVITERVTEMLEHRRDIDNKLVAILDRLERRP